MTVKSAIVLLRMVKRDPLEDDGGLLNLHGGL